MCHTKCSLTKKPVNMAPIIPPHIIHARHHAQFSITARDNSLKSVWTLQIMSSRRDAAMCFIKTFVKNERRI